MDFGQINIFLLIFIGIISAISIYGFSNPQFVEKYLFNISAIRTTNKWDRLLSSSFLHADGLHLFFNMYVLYMFAPSIMNSPSFGLSWFFIIYFGAVIGGGLLTYFMHKNNYAYRALGASGGVTGIVMASAVVNPDMGMGIIFVPIFIPAYIFGFLYLVYSIYAMQNATDNIGHDAHLGGAIVGIFLPILLYPQLLAFNFFKIGLLILPLIYLAYYIYQRR
jgi:membrane associated rhomboid family serine protease